MADIIANAYARLAEIEAMTQDLKPEKRTKHAKFFPVYVLGTPAKKGTYQYNGDLYECFYEGCTTEPGKGIEWRKIDPEATDLELLD